ncbi:MAG TPA: DUF4430 domain-containing protein [Solirubrobacteraceae bacterium]|nr:DUF4430 domain-containing protein [Solirubrobacteraceae bacterium]
MNRKTVAALVGALAMALAVSSVALAAGSGPAVSVQVKTLSKTLLRATGVHGKKGSITKGKTPKGKCPGRSAAGALDAATHGRWTGKYFASVSGIFVTSILGVKPPGHDFWELVVNGKPASQGICSVKLHAGERLLFKIAK